MTPSVITVKIGGTDVTSLVEGSGSSLSLDLRQNDQRSTGQITVKSIDGSYRPESGQEIEVREDGVLMFTGSIDQVTESKMQYGPNDITKSIWLVCLLVDLSARLDSIYFHYSFAHMKTGAMALYIMTTWGSNETIVFGPTGGSAWPSGTGYVDDGVLLEGPIPFDVGSISAALDWLATQAGKIWFIDAERNLHMQDRLATDAPFSITDDSLNYTALTVQKSRADYVNTAWTKENFYSGSGSFKTWSGPGDGAKRVFDLGILTDLGGGALAGDGLLLVIGVTLNGTPVQFGATGSGQPYTWDVGGGAITQDAAETLLTSGDTLAVGYHQLGADWIQTTVDEAITARAAIEGNSGVYGGTYSDTAHQYDRVGAQAAALANVTPKAAIPTVITIGIDGPEGKPRPGMIITVSVTLPLVSGSFLAQEVAAVFQSGIGFRYTVTAIDGRRVPNWVDYFKSLGAGGGGGGSVLSSGGGGGGGGGGTVAQGYYAITVSDTNHATPDLSKGTNQEVILDRATTAIDAPTNSPGPVAWSLLIEQDATGGRAVTFSADYLGADALPARLNTLANTYSVLTFIIRPDNKLALANILTGLPLA